MGAGNFNCSKPLLLGWDGVLEDLIQGVASQEGLVSQEEVLKTLVKLRLNLGVQGLSLLDPGSRLGVVVENIVLAGPHGMGDGQELLDQGSCPGLYVVPRAAGTEVLCLDVGSL